MYSIYKYIWREYDDDCYSKHAYDKDDDAS